MGVELDVRRRSVEEHERLARKNEQREKPRVVQSQIKRLTPQTVATHASADIYQQEKEARANQPKTIPFTDNVQAAMAQALGPKAAEAARNQQTFPGMPDDLGKKGSAAKVDKIVNSTSDNHLNAGVNPATKQINSLEDAPPENDIQAVRVAFHHQRQAIHFSQLEPGLRDKLLDASSRLERVVLGDTTAHFSSDDFIFLRESVHVKVILADLGDRIDFMKIIKVDDKIAYPDGPSEKYKGPKNTPANIVAQIQIAAQGHPLYFRMMAAKLLAGERIDMIVGNHDDALLNKYVWDGFKEEVVKAGMKSFDVKEEEIRQALTGMRLNLLKLYGDALHDHGHRFVDKYNMLGDQLKELVDPTPEHEEMPASFGFYGVRKSYNGVMSKNPIIDHLSGWEWAKWVAAHPVQAAKVAWGFIYAVQQGGYKISREHDIARDLQNIHRVVHETDIVESFNQDLPAGSKPVDADYVEGFLRTLYFAGPAPFLSNFKEGTGLFSRLATYAKLRLTGKMDTRPVDQVLVDSTAAVQKYSAERGGPAINKRVSGHTHDPRWEVHLSEDGKTIEYLNDGSGLYQKTDDPSNLTFNKHDHGTVVTHMGTTGDGKPWNTTTLHRITDSKGTMLPAHMVELDNPSMKKAQKMVKPIVTNIQKKKDATASP